MLPSSITLPVADLVVVAVVAVAAVVFLRPGMARHIVETSSANFSKLVADDVKKLGITRYVVFVLFAAAAAVRRRPVSDDDEDDDHDDDEPDETDDDVSRSEAMEAKTNS